MQKKLNLHPILNPQDPDSQFPSLEDSSIARPLCLPPEKTYANINIHICVFVCIPPLLNHKIEHVVHVVPYMQIFFKVYFYLQGPKNSDSSKGCQILKLFQNQSSESFHLTEIKKMFTHDHHLVTDLTFFLGSHQILEIGNALRPAWSGAPASGVGTIIIFTIYSSHPLQKPESGVSFHQFLLEFSLS